MQTLTRLQDPRTAFAGGAPEHFGLIFGWLLDGHGGAQPLDWAGVRAWKPGDGLLWVHLNRTMPQAQAWLRTESGLDALACDVLLEEETRPRCVNMGAGVLINLRGINLNPEAEPQDMVSVRLWIESGRILSLRRTRVMGIKDIAVALAGGAGPRDQGEFLASFAEHIADRITTVIESLEDSLDVLEDDALTKADIGLSDRLTEVRLAATGLRRYIAPQREAMVQARTLAVSWLGEDSRRYLRETTDQTHRFIEDLEAIRERALILYDRLDHQLSSRMTKTMYILSLVTALFMPLTFITGLFGMNVGGIPFNTHEWGFGVVSLGCLVAVYGTVLVFKRLRWI